MRRGDGGFEVDEAVVGGLEEIRGVSEEGVPAVVVRVGFAGFGGFDDGLVGDDVSGGDEGDAGGFAGVGAGVDAGFSAAGVTDEGDGGAAEQGAENKGAHKPGEGLLEFDGEHGGGFLVGTESGYIEWIPVLSAVAVGCVFGVTNRTQNRERRCVCRDLAEFARETGRLGAENGRAG